MASRKFHSLITVILFAGLSSPVAWSAGFALQEQGISGLGNSYAGAAAAAEDASTVYFAAAGISRLERP